MRTIRQLPIPQDTNTSEFPDGTIQNETDVLEGTPVVREIYGDVLTNIYAIMRDAGITPSGGEDNETSGYQFLQALKQFANEINDVNQVITVSGVAISVGFDIGNLPDKYVFTGVLSDALEAGQVYTINGGLTLTPTENYAASTQVLIILDGSGAKIYSLVSNSTATDVHIPFEYPFSFNDTNQTHYFINERTLLDTPANYNTGALIRVSESNANLIVIDAVFFKGNPLYLVLDIVTNEYKLFAGLSSFVEVTGLNSGTSTDYGVFMYCDGEFLYFSNSDSSGVNRHPNDQTLMKFSYDEVSQTVVFVSKSEVDENFQKTTNYFINNNILYTLIEGNLYGYPLDGSARVFTGFYNTTNGIVFSQGGNVYFSTGEFAKKWVI